MQEWDGFMFREYTTTARVGPINAVINWSGALIIALLNVAVVLQRWHCGKMFRGWGNIKREKKAGMATPRMSNTYFYADTATVLIQSLSIYPATPAILAFYTSQDNNRQKGEYEIRKHAINFETCTAVRVTQN